MPAQDDWAGIIHTQSADAMVRRQDGRQEMIRKALFMFAASLMTATAFTGTMTIFTVGSIAAAPEA